jgi:predicted peptidase
MGATPVVLYLHGAGERGDDGLRHTEAGLLPALRARSAEPPAVIVMPQCLPGRTWSSPGMQALALAALDAAVAEFGGAPDRLYATGLSMGGYGVWELAAARPRRFAAYAVVCGGLRPPAGHPDIRHSLVDDPSVPDPYAELARRAGPTPAWLFHGEDDATVPAEESRRVHAALRAGGADARITVYPGVGHGSWLRAYGEPGLWDWLLAQRLR